MTGIELSILDFIQSNFRSGIMDALMVIVTHMGDLGAVWIAAALALFLKGGERKAALAIIAAIVIATIVGDFALEPLVARPRPCDVDAAVQLLVARPTDFSFPSGHAAAAFATTSVLFLARSRWRIPAVILASLIAFSRLYLFVHYPTDVLGGALLGILCGWLAWEMCGFASKGFSHAAGFDTGLGRLYRRCSRVKPCSSRSPSRVDSEAISSSEAPDQYKLGKRRR